METSTEITSLITPVLNAFKVLDDEWKNFCELGLFDYLNSQTQKYYFTNTFIHRSEKVTFSQIYYPISAKYKNFTTNFEDIEFTFEDHRYITIIGSAGSGKTTLIRYIFLNCIKSLQRIPILIELRHLNEYNGNFERLLTEKVLKFEIKPSDRIFRRALKSGKFLFLLDGYDEIFSDKKQEVNRQIELFVDAYPENRFLITTRPGSGIESFNRFNDFKVCELNDNDVEAFIDKIVTEQERRERILKIIKDKKNRNYIAYLRNPLLLSMFIMAFESHPEIPKRKNAFYRNVFDTLYSMHDGITKNSFPREKLTKLQREDFEKILSAFSYLSMMEGQYSFTHEYLTDTLGKVVTSLEYKCQIEDLIYDLRTSISILVLDGLEYSFPHRSMQEYFTALFISKLPTEKKVKAYRNLSDILERSSTDNSFNFWSLCRELDEIPFTTYFLIPKVKKFYKLVDFDDEYKLFDGFSALVKPIPLLKDSDNDKSPKLAIYRQNNFYNSLIDFCNIYSYEDLFEFPSRSAAHDELLKIYYSSTDSKDFVPHNDIKPYKDVLMKHGVVKVLSNYREFIKKQIIEWEDELKRKKQNIDDLLTP